LFARGSSQSFGATGLGYQAPQPYCLGLDLIYASPVVAWISSAYIRRSETLAGRVIMASWVSFNCLDSSNSKLES
jgi:hypothetical protein